ncbi:MAG: radical SAM protein [Myxococcota bacterium]
MHITFIEPTWNYDIHCMSEPLGMLYLSAVLRKAGHEVSLIHTLYKELDQETLVNSDLIGFYSSTPQFDNTVALLKRVRVLAPLVPVVIGGPHATTMPEDALRAGFHAAFQGEAEFSLLEFIENFANERPFETRGISFLDDGKFVRNPPQRIYEDLDEIPFPARDLFDYKAYRDAGGWEYGIMGSRGCVHNCTFCQPTINNMFRHYRKRSARNIALEIAGILEKYDPPLLYFKDDTIASNGIEWFKTLKREFASLGIKPPPWRCNNRVDMCGEKLIEAMVEAGCAQIALGVESGSQRILDFYQKGVKVEDAIKAFETCRKFGIEPSANIIIGAPIETKEDLEMTYDLLERLQPTNYWVFILTALPCKQVTDYAKENNLLKPNAGYHLCDTAINGIRGETNFRHKYLTEHDLLEIRDRIFKRFPQRQYEMMMVYEKEGYVPTPKRVEEVIAKIKAKGNNNQ